MISYLSGPLLGNARAFRTVKRIAVLVNPRDPQQGEVGRLDTDLVSEPSHRTRPRREVFGDQPVGAPDEVAVGAPTCCDPIREVRAELCLDLGARRSPLQIESIEDFLVPAAPRRVAAHH